jgi:hypothetical protein
VPFNTVGIGPIPYKSPTQFSPTLQATGLSFTGSGTTYPTYNSSYVKDGFLVSFWIEVNLSTVTNFGTGQYKLQLPFPPHTGTLNHFPGWIWYDPGVNPDPDLANHIVLNVDHQPGSQTLDLHWLGGDTPSPKPVREFVLTGTSPYTLTTISKIYINGTYFTDIL